jgi:hypothetical protein
MFTIAEVIRLLTRIFVKQNKRFPKGLEGVDIRLKAKEIFDVGKANNYKGGISENQIKHFLAWEKQAPVIKEVSKDILKIPKKKGEVLDLTGKKIDTSKPILGGKNVPESEAEIAARLTKENKESIKRFKDKMKDPEDLAYGGIAGMLGEPTYLDGGRVPLGAGKFVFDAARRKFLQWLGAGAATAGVAKSGLFSLLKAGKPTAQVLTSVPIKAGVDGMPAWFKPLVNKVIKEGDDVSKRFATVDREIVHTKKIDKFEEVTVYQDLNTGNVRVEYGPHLTDSKGKVIRASNDDQIIQFEYRAPEIVDDASRKAGKEIKTKPEFSASEAEPEVISWDGDIEWTGDNTVNNVKDLLTDTSKLQKYATGKKLTIKEISESMKKQKYKEKIDTDTTEAIKHIEIKHGPFPDPGDYPGGKDSTIKAFDDYYGRASGGRVPLNEGGIGDTEIAADIDKSLNQLMEDFKLYKDYGGRGNLKYYINKYRALRFLHKEGGRVPFKKGKTEWLQLLDKDWDEDDPDHWELIKKLLLAGEIGAAEGGRVPLGGGAIVKGGNWLLKALRGTREAIKRNKDYSPERIKLWVGQIDDQIRIIKDGGPIPDEVIQTIRKDPKFKSVWQNQKSADPDLREMEEVLLEYGKKHASGGLAGMLGE